MNKENNSIKKMKNTSPIILLISTVLMMSLIFCSCGNNGGREEKKSDVEQLLDNAKTEAASSEITTEASSETILDTAVAITEATTEIAGNTTQTLDGINGQYAPNMSTGDITTEYPLATGPSQTNGSGAVSPGHGSDEEDEPVKDADPNVDVDLTALSSNMVYAEVYNMLMTPDEYLGKTIKVSGPYYPLYYDGTGNYYHYIMIEDALACCQNGIEFIWDKGEHIYPDEYPKEDDIIEITGVYSVYKEEGYTYYYLDIDEYSIIE